MNRLFVGHVLSLGLLVVLVVLALSACGGEKQQVSKPQPLPEEEQQMRTGVYRSEEFKPSLTFRVQPRTHKQGCLKPYRAS
jgi:hypothetical protein